jgi:hypothetical protein
MEPSDTKSNDFACVDFTNQEVAIRLQSALAILKRKAEERKQAFQQQVATTKDTNKQFVTRKIRTKNSS